MKCHDDFYADFHTEMYRFAAEQSFYAAVYAKRTLEAGFTTDPKCGRRRVRRRRSA